VKEKADQLKLSWRKQKEVIDEAARISKDLEEKKGELVKATREGDLEKAAQLKYGVIPEMEKKLEAQNTLLESQEKGGVELKQSVTEEEIAQVVSRWTGIPVSRMMETEVARLVNLEERLGKRVIGQEQAIHAVARPSSGRALACPTPTVPSAASSSWGRRAWARPNCPRRSPRFSSTTRTAWCAST